MPATITNGALNQLAIGTDRVWFTTDWGGHWVTLPNGLNDPRTGGVNNAQDALPKDGGAVRVLRWATVNQLWVLCKRGLYQMQRDNTGRWKRSDVSLKDVLHPASSTDVSSQDFCNDIAVHNPQVGPFGSLYLALLGDLGTDEDDSLWWWDGTSKWHKTGLASKTNAAALGRRRRARPHRHRLRRHVHRRVPRHDQLRRRRRRSGRTGAASTTAFRTSPCRTSPSSPAARSGCCARPPRREVSGSSNSAGPVTDRTYVRVHQDDTRRTLPTSVVAPFEPKIADPADATRQIDTTYRWHASPDLRVHPKLGPMAAPTSLPWTRAKPAGTTADRFGFWKLWRFQTALRREDLRSEPTGRWDLEFDAVLRGNGVPTPGGNATINKAYWESKVTGANLTRLPWDTPRPSEADLAEYLPAESNPFGDRQPSVVVPPGTLTAYVLLHHRGATPAASADVQVTLLYRVVSKWQGKASTAWVTGNVGWTAAIAKLLEDGTPPPPFAPWLLADTTTPRHSPVDDVLAGSPAVATFDVDLSAVKDKQLVLLVAVVHSANDHVTLTEAPLRDLTLASPHVAVRSVLVRT